MTQASQFKSPGLVPWIFIIFATLVTFSLGVWQLERLEWKEGQLAAIAQGQSLPQLAALPDEAEKLAGAMYRRVVLTGHFDDHIFLKIGANKDYPSGFFVLTPFTIYDTDQHLLVKRGFVPGTQEEVMAILKANMPGAMEQVTGILRPAHTARTFTPENKPADNLWFSEDLTAIGEISGLSLLPLVVEATGDSVGGDFPIHHSGEIRLKNDHLGYAFIWFAIGIAGLVMFGFYCRKPWKQEKQTTKKDK